MVLTFDHESFFLIFDRFLLSTAFFPFREKPSASLPDDYKRIGRRVDTPLKGKAICPFQIFSHPGSMTLVSSIIFRSSHIFSGFVEFFPPFIVGVE